MKRRELFEFTVYIVVALFMCGVSAVCASERLIWAAFIAAVCAALMSTAAALTWFQSVLRVIRECIEDES